MEKRINVFQIADNIKNVDKVENLRIDDDFYSASVESANTKAEAVEIDGLAGLRKQFPQCTDEQLRKAKRFAFPETRIISIGKNI